METTILGYIGVILGLEKKMEATIVYWGHYLISSRSPASRHGNIRAPEGSSKTWACIQIPRRLRYRKLVDSLIPT